MVAPGTGKGTVNESLEVEAGTAIKDVETVNGGIRASQDEVRGDVETVNGKLPRARYVSAVMSNGSTAASN